MRPRVRDEFGRSRQKGADRIPQDALTRCVVSSREFNSCRQRCARSCQIAFGEQLSEFRLALKMRSSAIPRLNWA